MPWEDRLRAVERLVAELVAELPDGAVELERSESDDALAGHVAFRLTPAEVGAAAMRIYVYKPADTIELAAGRAASFQFEDADAGLPEAVRELGELARAVAAGALEETVHVREGRLLRGEATWYRPGGPITTRMQFAERGANKGGEPQSARYSPYAAPTPPPPEA
jgi:hypothetical protein